mmetsp:Transcript_50848/g.80598  ORF Transcript_50848/g.80598 Transcript_50848/m.80598 type:complete len:504 (+) Transcript_50848:114-1625(+)|eukprot:CAMPEP_0169105150 /NCGR_PEP_ID=MMETSP1015-20121227/23636_1 /TAXON_ID=342587 /ORGANISM="Karlodinium micrum, Strain CCMP2283" /LENGTH=503 /DNA_ID=CAMNT_0009166477 /DNA_START=114 /DNA_END=1625 /DNA_ORIENTATION=+
MSANPQDHAADELRESNLATGLPGTIDLDKVMADIGIGRFHYQILWLFGVGFSACAIEVVLMAFLLPELRARWKLDEYQLGLLAASSSVASILGQMFWGAVADKYGRRFVFMSTVLVVALFGGLSALSQTALFLICMRSAVAFGIGGNISVDFSLYTEFMPTEGRGRMLLCMQAFWPLGQLVTCLAAWWIIPGSGWRVFVVACTVPSLLTGFFRPFIPESPRWLVLHGRAEEATQVCRKMAIKNGHRPEDLGLKEGVMVDLPTNSVTPLVVSGSSLVKKGKTKPEGSLAGKLFNSQYGCTTVGTILFSAALHAVSYGSMTFLPSMLERKGIHSGDKYFFMVLNSVSEFPGVFGIMALSHLLGRLFPMKVSLLVIALSFLIFSMAQESAGILTCVCLNAVFIESGWACYHTYLPEVYPTEMRATATGFVNSVACMMSALVPLCAAYFLDRYGVDKACMFFAAVALVGSIGSFLFLHVETHDRDLEDVVTRKDGSAKIPLDDRAC